MKGAIIFMNNYHATLFANTSIQYRMDRALLKQVHHLRETRRERRHLVSRVFLLIALFWPHLPFFGFSYYLYAVSSLNYQSI